MKCRWWLNLVFFIYGHIGGVQFADFRNTGTIYTVIVYFSSSWRLLNLAHLWNSPISPNESWPIIFRLTVLYVNIHSQKLTHNISFSLWVLVDHNFRNRSFCLIWIQITVPFITWVYSVGSAHHCSNPDCFLC